jgi:hypothetical protein
MSKLVLRNIITLLDSLVMRDKYVFRGGDKSKEGTEVDLKPIYGDKWEVFKDKFYEPCLNNTKFDTEDVPYLGLREYIANINRTEPDSIFDVTAISKTFLGDIFAIAITERVSNLHTFDVGKPDFEEPWKSLIHAMGKYNYVNLLNTSIFKECSNLISVTQSTNENPNIVAVEQDLKLTKSERDKYSYWFKVSLGLFFIALSITLLFLLPVVISWQWFNQHPKRLGLQICSLLILGGIFWAIIDKRNRQWSVGTIIIGAVLVMIQIL